MSGRWISGCLAVASVLAADNALAAPRQPDDQATGPVSVLMLPEEHREFDQIITAAESRRFMSRFWARRDPDPSTTINEFRAEFMDRLAYVNKEFIEPARPGWATARGQLYLLLGSPDSVRSSSRQVPIDGAYRHLVAWEYRAPGSGRSVVFRFAPTRSGTRLVVSNGRLSSEQAEMLDSTRRRPLERRRRAVTAAAERSPTSLASSIMARQVAGGVLATLATPLRDLLGTPSGDAIRYRFQISTGTRRAGTWSERAVGSIEVEMGPDEFSTWAGFELHIAVWLPAGADSYRITEALTGRTAVISAVTETAVDGQVPVAHTLATAPLENRRGVAIAYMPTCPIRRPAAEAFIVERTAEFNGSLLALPGGRLALAQVVADRR